MSLFIFERSSFEDDYKSRNQNFLISKKKNNNNNKNANFLGMNYVKLYDLRKIYDNNSSLKEAHRVMKDKNYFSIVLGMYKYEGIQSCLSEDILFPKSIPPFVKDDLTKFFFFSWF